MPYLDISRHLDKEVGEANDLLLALAKRQVVKSPDISEAVTIHGEVREVKEKEAVGLGFNRYVMTTLKNRWHELEEKQILMKEDMARMHDYLHEDKVRMDSSAREAAKDRIQNLLLGSRIRQLEGHCFNLQSYFNMVKDLIKYYKPAKIFMRDLADRMNFQNESQIINRHRTLTLIKKEMSEEQMTSVEAIEHEKLKLKNVKEENLHIQLQLSNEINELSEKYQELEKKNSAFEYELSRVMSEASETARATFRTSTGIRRIYESILHQRNQEMATFNPFEMLGIIGRRFQNLKSVVDEIIRIKDIEIREKLRLCNSVSSRKVLAPKRGKNKGKSKDNSKMTGKAPTAFDLLDLSKEHETEPEKEEEKEKPKRQFANFRMFVKKTIIEKHRKNQLEQKESLGRQHMQRKVTIKSGHTSRRPSDSEKSLTTETNTNQSNRNCLHQLRRSTTCLPPINPSQNSDDFEKRPIGKEHVLHSDISSSTHTKIPMTDSSVLVDKKPIPSISSSQKTRSQINRKTTPCNGSSNKVKSNITRKPVPPICSPNKARSSISRKPMANISSSNRNRSYMNRKPIPSIVSPQKAKPYISRKVNLQKI